MENTTLDIYHAKYENYSTTNENINYYRCHSILKKNITFPIKKVL